MTKKSNQPTNPTIEQQLQEVTAALQRERADAVNLRRRYDQDIANLRVSAKAAVVRELLPVIDNFERALKHAPHDLEGDDFVKGVKAIVKQFEKTLEQMGVAKIKTVGEPFNPHFHEAVSVDEKNEGEEIVSEELQAGYILGNEVLRHAMVRVKHA